jgi:transcriptional regulator with XRE-family HTH domain
MAYITPQIAKSLYMLNLQLKKIRNLKGKTQEEVAAAIGVGARTYQSYEAGTSDIKMSDLEKLAEYLGVEPADFFVKESGNGDRIDIQIEKAKRSNVGKENIMTIESESLNVTLQLLKDFREENKELKNTVKLLQAEIEDLKKGKA